MARRLSRGLLVIVAIVLVVMLAAGGFLFATGGLGNTDTQQITNYGVTGGGASGGLGDQTTPKGQLLDQAQYIASWSPTLSGQRVTEVGALKIDPSACGLSCTGIGVSEVEMRIMLIDPNGALVHNEQKFIQLNPANVQPNTWYEVGNHFWDIRSPDGKTIIPDGSEINGQLLAHVIWFKPFPFPNEDKGWVLAATDRAVVQSGIGTTHWRGGHSDSAGGIYVITGESIDACWDVGYSSDSVSGTGWSLQIFSGAQNQVVLGPQRVALSDSQLQGCVPYRTVDADFARGTTNSQLIVTLRNELWNKDFQVLATVRAADVPRMPVCYDDGFSPQSPKQGDTITYRFHCDPANDDPLNAVASIKVQWGYGSLDNEAVLPGGATQYQFAATEPGLVNLALTGFTADGVPSGAHNYRISIEHQPDNTCIGSEAYCKPGADALGIPLWLWFVFAGLAMVLAAVFIPRGILPTLVKIVMFLIAIVFILLAVIFFG
jgi:hypothetical protein